MREDCCETTPSVQSPLFKAAIHGGDDQPHDLTWIRRYILAVVRFFAVLEGCDPEVELAYAEVIAMKSGVG